MPAAINEHIIFNAALKVMTERGYVGATTKLIAEEAGIGEVTLFRRFGNKETLIVEAMKHEASKVDSAASLYTGKLEVDLVNIVTAYQLLLRARAALLLTFYTEVTRHPELAPALEQPKRTIGKMLEMLKRYQNERKLVVRDPMHQLSELFGPIMMLTLFGTVYQGEAQFDTRTHVRSFLKGNRR